MLAETTSTSFLRGDGGFGGSPEGAPVPHVVPDRKPDLVDDFRTVPPAALIYRLSGDYNPLHAEPDVATTAGFPSRSCMGCVRWASRGHAILRHVCGWEPSRMTSLALRFTSPVFPGETDPHGNVGRRKDVSFRAKVVERGKTVLDNGHATVA